MSLAGRLRRRRFRRLLRRHGFGLAFDQPTLSWQELWRRGSTFVLLSMLSDGHIEAELSKRGRLYGYIYSTRDLSQRVTYR